MGFFSSFDTFGKMGAAAIAARPPAPVITTTSPLPGGTQDQAYSRQLAATGTVTAWTLESGTLPTGVTLSSGGLLSGTPTNSGTFGSLVIRATGPGGFSEVTFSLTITAWHVALVAAIEAATGATCTHAFFVGAPTTTKNVGGDPAANGDRIYKIFDLKAGAYDYIEGGANKGGIYRAASVGTRAAMELLRTNSEYMKTTKNANAASPALIPAGNNTAIIVGKFSDNNVDSSTARFNPLIWGSSDMGSAGGAAPSLLLRDNTTNRIHSYNAGGSLVQVNSTAAPYDTPLVLSTRNKRDPSGVAVVGSNKTYNSTAANADITSLAKLFHMGLGADYLSGHIACGIVLNAYIDDTTMDAVTDLINTAFGI
jgi:hypothetical protein